MLLILFAGGLVVFADRTLRVGGERECHQGGNPGCYAYSRPTMQRFTHGTGNGDAAVAVESSGWIFRGDAGRPDLFESLHNAPSTRGRDSRACSVVFHHFEERARTVWTSFTQVSFCCVFSVFLCRLFA